jgi:hypothetical protein
MRATSHQTLQLSMMNARELKFATEKKRDELRFWWGER